MTTAPEIPFPVGSVTRPAIVPVVTSCAIVGPRNPRSRTRQAMAPETTLRALRQVARDMTSSVTAEIPCAAGHCGDRTSSTRRVMTGASGYQKPAMLCRERERIVPQTGQARVNSLVSAIEREAVQDGLVPRVATHEVVGSIHLRDDQALRMIVERRLEPLECPVPVLETRIGDGEFSRRNEAIPPALLEARDGPRGVPSAAGRAVGGRKAREIVVVLVSLDRELDLADRGVRVAG